MLGEKAITVPGGVSLANAAEELSLHMAEKAEDKHHAERKIKGERPAELLRTDEIVELLEQTHDPDAQEKLTELVKHLLSGQASPRQAASQAFGEVSQQYLGLQQALHEGERQGAPADILEAIRDALADLELESGPEIRAGLNSLPAAGAYAADAAGVVQFQRTYRDVVLGENSLAKTLNLALERFGDTGVARGLKQLIAALGQDLAATRPSVDPNRLQALVADLYYLEVAATVLDGCGELAAKLDSQFGCAVDSSNLMRDLVSVSGEKWVAESRFSGLAAQHGVVPAEGRIAFLAGVRAMLKDLPVQIYPDVDTRHGILNAAQEALDVAIDEEDQ